jgi:5-oxoprolinase (ATP-hydrolysing)
MQAVYDQGIRALAIVLLHAWRFPEQELQLAALAEQIGFNQISLSHQISPLMKIVSRGDTTVVDAYLSPLLRQYVRQFAAGLGKQSRTSRWLCMQFNGGLSFAKLFLGCCKAA